MELKPPIVNQQNLQKSTNLNVICVIKDVRANNIFVCAQPFCAGNATVIWYTSLRLTGPEDKHGVENAREKNQAEFTPLDRRWPLFF